MTRKLLATGGVIAAFAFAQQAHANNVPLTFSGGGISGSGVLTFDPTQTDPISGGAAITGISGTFSDSNTVVPISSASITGLRRGRG